MTRPVIIYHHNCHDGITALWAAKQKYPDADAYPGIYGEPPDLVMLRDQDVILVDFSYKRPALEAVAKVAKSVLILDHHKTAESELRGIEELPNVGCVFDMERSGAGITWDYFFGRESRPDLITYVEDRDLWRFALPNSKEVHAACGLWDLTLPHRDLLVRTPIADLAAQGATVLQYHNRLVCDAAKGAWRSTVGGHDNIPTIGNPVMAIMSDLLHELAQGEKFAAGFYQRSGKRIYSLRSDENGLDVSEIARTQGGGGHKHAAGFEVLL